MSVEFQHDVFLSHSTEEKAVVQLRVERFSRGTIFASPSSAAWRFGH